MATSAATITGADVLSVHFGTQSFAFGDDWPGYITGKLSDAITQSAKGITLAAAQFLADVSQYVTQTHGSKPWNGQLVNDSNQLQRRTGGLIDQFNAKSTMTGSDSDMDEISVTNDLGVFGIHVDGGTITARGAKYLAIPLPSACDRRGVPLRASPRDWEDTFVMKSRAGNLLICQRSGKSVTPLYLLKSSVYIPARLTDFPKMWGEKVDRFQTAMIAEIERQIDNINW